MKQTSAEWNMNHWTELANTLGAWGGAPLSTETQVKVVEASSRWATLNNATVSMECYINHPDDHAAAVQILELAAVSKSLRPVARVRPVSQNFKMAASMGFEEVLIEIPAGSELAEKWFSPGGIKRSAEFLREHVLELFCQELTPHICLMDFVHADKNDVKEMVHSINKLAKAYQIQPHWRLVDSTGIALPFSHHDSHRSLPGWLDFMVEECGLSPQQLHFQGADFLGMASANSLLADSTGISAVTSMFGLGVGAGWGVTELLIAQWDHVEDMKSLIELKPVLDSDTFGRLHPNQPVSGSRAFQAVAATTPEKLDEEWQLALPFNPASAAGLSVEPLLSELSGHAGLLNLIHRHFPEIHIETEEPVVREIYRRYEDEFKRGRKQPVSWEEVSAEVMALLRKIPPQE